MDLNWSKMDRKWVLFYFKFKYFSSGNCSIRISGSFLKRDYCVAKNSFILRGTGQLKDRFQKNLFVSKKGLGEKQKSGCCHTKVAKNGHSGEVKFSWLCAYTNRKVHLKRLFKSLGHTADFINTFVSHFTAMKLSDFDGLSVVFEYVSVENHNGLFFASIWLIFGSLSFENMVLKRAQKGKKGKKVLGKYKSITKLLK